MDMSVASSDPGDIPDWVPVFPCSRIYVYDHGYLLTLPARISWMVR